MCKYHIIHSPLGFSGIIYNTGWGTLPRLLKVQFTSKEGVSDAPIHELESEIDQYTGHYLPYSLRRVCGFFNVPQIFYRMCKGLWDGAYGLSSLFEKTRKSNLLQMLLKRLHFLLSYLKTLSAGPAGIWTYGLPLSRPALILSGGYDPNTCSHCTKMCHSNYPICDAPLSRSAQRIFAP